MAIHDLRNIVCNSYNLTKPSVIPILSLPLFRLPHYSLVKDLAGLGSPSESTREGTTHEAPETPLAPPLLLRRATETCMKGQHFGKRHFFNFQTSTPLYSACLMYVRYVAQIRNLKTQDCKSSTRPMNTHEPEYPR